MGDHLAFYLERELPEVDETTADDALPEASDEQSAV